MSEAFLKLDKIVKSFSGVKANRGISLEIGKGEIHALLGENGAGKTVLMSIVYGLCQPDAGSIVYRGEVVEIRSSREAIKRGIGMVHQHFMLVPTLTVAENIVLGQYPPWKVLREMDKVESRIEELSQEFGLKIDPRSPVHRLSVGEQQRVEILKALYQGVDLLILDEPTAVLTPQETDGLLSFLKEMTERGLTVIFITHKLDEVMRASDRVTVLRDGREVATVQTAETNPRALARLMVGREVFLEPPPREGRVGKNVLSVKNLSVDDERGLPAVRDITFEVKSGEIVGIAGVSGNGQSELALALAGLRPVSSGEIYFLDTPATNLSPRKLSRLGLAHVPEDRHKMGIVLPFTVAENFILHDFGDPPFARNGFLHSGVIRGHARKLAQKYAIRHSAVDQEIAHLSGGNQQKVVVARELRRNPRLLLVNEPARGIDIGATEFVRRQIAEARDAGSAVLLISSDLEELFALSDRLLIFYEGKIVGQAPTNNELIEEIGLMMAGQKIENYAYGPEN